MNNKNSEESAKRETLENGTKEKSKERSNSKIERKALMGFVLNSESYKPQPHIVLNFLPFPQFYQKAS